ncbi:hypothetical protein [Streptomyces sp. NPDC058751]|uniref:hypothetical protein n=1 Tax=Streptomyces sp. NPDC058751 TaxID=3346623 RepID=UPI0036BEC8DC
MVVPPVEGADGSGAVVPPVDGEGGPALREGGAGETAARAAGTRERADEGRPEPGGTVEERIPALVTAGYESLPEPASAVEEGGLEPGGAAFATGVVAFSRTAARRPAVGRVRSHGVTSVTPSRNGSPRRVP